MRKINQFIFISLIIGLFSFISSCSDNDEVSEWNMTYVSLLPADYLRPIPSFALDHIVEEGISGSVEFQFVAKIQKATDQDIKVNIDAIYESKSKNISGANIDFTSKTALIKAGSISSEPITISVTNWDELVEIEDKAEYILKIKISGIETLASNITSSDLYQDIALEITKKAEREREVVLLTNPSNWIFTFMEGVENPNSNTVAGTGSSDVATNGVPFWLTVDFKEVKTITALQTYYYGMSYAARKVKIFTSENNRDWVSIGEFTTSGKIQTINFAERVQTRYMKYEMITVPARVSMTKFNIYSFE